MSTPIATIGKNASEEVRVTLDEFKGHRLCDARVFSAFSAAAVPMPTKKGLSVRVDMLPDLIAALQQAEITARMMGWIGGEA